MEMPIRVLHVVTHMNRGGLETMIMNYYRNVDRSVIQFDFLTHRPESEIKDYDSEITDMGGKIYHINRLNPFSFSYRKQLRDFFSQHPEYKIIHVHQDCMSGVILKEAKKMGVPVRIAHCHSSSQDKDLKYLLKVLFKRNIRKHATSMFACGMTAGKWMFGTDDFKVLPNAIDALKFSYSESQREDIRLSLNIPNDAFVVIHVGRFSLVKNHSFLVDVFEQLHKLDSNSYLVLVGQGPEMESIIAKVKEMDVKNVLFLGLRSDVNALLQAGDVFVLPSLYEGLPVCIVEAQAAGLPCIISNGVPNDCSFIDCVEQIALEDSLDLWARKIYSYRNYKRVNTYQAICDKGYDIRENAKFLQQFYVGELE